jgi:hypothetical protein
MDYGASYLLLFAWHGSARRRLLLRAFLGLHEPVRIALNGHNLAAMHQPVNRRHHASRSGKHLVPFFERPVGGDDGAPHMGVRDGIVIEAEPDIWCLGNRHLESCIHREGILEAHGPPGWNQRQTTKTGSKEIKPRIKARKTRFMTAIHTSRHTSRP